MLEEPANDRAHPDSLRKPGHSGAERAHAADDEVDLRAGLRRRVERVDDVGVDQVVDLDCDAAARLRLPVDELRDAGAQARWRHQQLAVSMLPAVAGEEVEQLRDVGAQVGVRRKQANVLVPVRRAGVVVAGADVHVVLDALPLAADDERHLGVGLKTDQPVNDMDVGLFECPCPRNVRLLIPASLELDERGHLLARLSRPDQRANDRAARPRGAIEGLLDGEHVGVARRLVDERFHRGRERVVWMMRKHIA